MRVALKIRVVVAAGVAGVAGVLWLCLSPSTRAWVGQHTGGMFGAYAGSSSCRECHESFYEKWAPSHHGKAMQPVTAEFVQTELTPLEAPLTVRGQTYRVDLGERQLVETAKDGKVTRYTLQHAMGGKNVFYFLTLLDKGKLDRKSVV